MTGRRAQAAWALADFAREPFFTFVLSLIFPPFFVKTLARDSVHGTIYWGYGLAATSLALVVLAPFAGSLADASGRSRPWLLMCLALTLCALGSLWFATSQPGHILWTLLSVAGAQLGVELSRIYTDTLLPVVAPAESTGRLSGIAAGLGFGASVIYLALGYAVSGVATESVAARILTIGSGAWLALFMIPFLRYCSEPVARITSQGLAWRRSLTELSSSLRRLSAQPALRDFLIARMVYWDGTMSLFSFMTIVAATRLHWTTGEMSVFGVMGLLAAAVCGALGGFVDARLGPRRMLQAALIVLLGVTIALALLVGLGSAPSASIGQFSNPIDRAFLALAVAGSGALGVILGSSRSMLVTLARPERLGEAFGLYVMVGRASSFLAPFLVAVTTSFTGDQRSGIFGVATVLLIVGLLLLHRVPSDAGRSAGRP